MSDAKIAKFFHTHNIRFRIARFYQFHGKNNAYMRNIIAHTKLCSFIFRRLFFVRFFGWEFGRLLVILSITSILLRDTGFFRIFYGGVGSQIRECKKWIFEQSYVRLDFKVL